MDAAGSTPAPPAGEPWRSLRISILEGCSSAVFGALTGEAIATALLLALGGGDVHVGAMSALGTLATVGGLLGARAAGVVGRWKPLVVGPSLASRLSWAVAAALPFLPLTREARLWGFLALAFASSFLVNFAANPWISWMAAMVPEARRGRYFALRNTVVNAVGMSATYAVGHLVTRARAAAGGGPEVLAPFLAASLPFTLLTTWLYTRQWEPPGPREPPTPLHGMFRAAWRDPGFRRMMTFSMLWAAVCGVAGPFFMPHMLRHLGMTMRQVATYSILAGLVGLAAQPLWGRIADRAGHRPTLVFNVCAVGVLPLLWLAARPGRLWPIWLDALATGLFWPGLNLALFNLALGTAPPGYRTACLAVRSLSVGMVQAAAALLGGAIAHALEGRGAAGVNHHVLFVASSLGRFALVGLAARLSEERAQSVAGMVRMAGGAAGRLFADRLEAGWTWVRGRRLPAAAEDATETRSGS